MELDTLGKRLTYAMALEGIGQSELARRAGIKPQAVQYLCSQKGGKDKKSRYTPQLAKVLNVRVEWLANGEPPMRTTGLAYASPPAGPALRRIPLIQWRDLTTWSSCIKEPHGEDMVTAHVQMGEDGFAVVLIGEAMLPQFIPGMRLEIDPRAPIKSGDFVIAIPEGKSDPLFRKYIEEGGDRVLVAFDPRYKNEPCGKLIGRVMFYGMSL